MDYSHGKTPDSFDGKLVAATASCIAIGTLSEVDGETLIILTDENTNGCSDKDFIFDNSIETPNHEVSVCTAMNKCLMTIQSRSNHTRVRICVNDEKEPDRIEIVVNVN